MLLKWIATFNFSYFKETWSKLVMCHSAVERLLISLEEVCFCLKRFSLKQQVKDLFFPPVKHTPCFDYSWSYDWKTPLYVFHIRRCLKQHSRTGLQDSKLGVKLSLWTFAVCISLSENSGNLLCDCRAPLLRQHNCCSHLGEQFPAPWQKKGLLQKRINSFQVQSGRVVWKIDNWLKCNCYLYYCVTRDD